MKRFFFTPIIGDGIESAFRTAIDAVPGINWANYIPTWPMGHELQGQPKLGYTLVIASYTNENQIMAIPGVYALPDSRLDNLVSSIHPDLIQQLRNEMQARNLPDTYFWPNDTYRTVIYGIGQRMEPGFNLAAFDVPEVAG